MRKTGYFYLALASSLIGCTVGPNYKPPENVVSDEWASSEAEIDLSDSSPITDWWTIFNDSLLSKYIEKAAVFNKDILTAEANILQARAMRQIAASSFFPQLGVDVNATKTYFSKNGPVFAIGQGAGNSNATSSPVTGLPFSIQVPQVQNLYNALIDASWEIDLFGKTRRSVEAADANIGSAIEQRNNTLISVMAEIAINYMEIRGNQKQAKLVEENVRLLEQKAEIIQKQLETGYVSQLDYEGIQASLAIARAALPDIQAQIYRGIYTLSVLTGDVPETLVDELLPIQPLPHTPEEIVVGLRSDLLRRRPDVRQSERQLASATANIGVAVASFFPSFSLGADIGFQSLKVKNLFTAGSKTWAYGGDINLPIFQGGNLVGNLKASRAVAEAAAYIYQKTVLQALEETESNLVSYADDLATAREFGEAARRNQILVALSQERHDKGLVSLLNVLDSKSQLISVEQSLLGSQISALVDLIALYKALGGGWEPSDENQTHTSQ